jgi:hypothetical protein
MQSEHPVAYLSKALWQVAQTLSTYEKECLPILLVVDKWRQYLQHAPFTIVTDHRSLVHMSDQKITTGMELKAFVKLMGPQYKLVYYITFLWLNQDGSKSLPKDTSKIQKHNYFYMN